MKIDIIFTILVAAWGARLAHANRLILIGDKPNDLSICEGDWSLKRTETSRVDICDGIDENPWQDRQTICLYEVSALPNLSSNDIVLPGQKLPLPLACGKVGAILGSIVELRIRWKRRPLKEGDRVRLAPGIARTPETKVGPLVYDLITKQSLEGLESIKIRYETPYEALLPREIGLGLNLGLNYLYPTAQLQHVIIGGLYLGAMGMFSNAEQDDFSTLAYGLGANLSYYFKRSFFPGIWLRATAGWLRVTVTETGTKQSDSTYWAGAMVGWRAVWPFAVNRDTGPGGAFNMRIAGGFQYVGSVRPELDLSFRGLLPLILFEIGLGF